MERLYTVNLGDAYNYVRTKRAKRAVKLLRSFVKQHLKVDVVKISEEVNNYIWAHGIQKPPRKVRVKVVKEDDVAHVYLGE